MVCYVGGMGRMVCYVGWGEKDGLLCGYRWGWGRWAVMWVPVGVGKMVCMGSGGGEDDRYGGGEDDQYLPTSTTIYTPLPPSPLLMHPCRGAPPPH